jgi:TRAP-type C4-dicarboxylate transport system substrate-binding protein
VGVLLALALTWSAPAAAKQLRIATLAPDGTSWMLKLGKAAKQIKAATSGRVELKYLPGGQQGDERDVVRKMRTGTLDGAALTGTGLSLIDESIRVLELPMLFKDTAELDCVRAKIWPHFRERFAKKGFALGEPTDVGFIYFYSKKPVRSLANLKRTKVWMWTDDRIVRAIYKKLGINGVPMGVPDVARALANGRLDAAYGAPISTVAFQWYRSVKYVTSMPMTYAIGATVVRRDVYAGLGTGDRQAVQRTLAATGRDLRKTIRRDNRKAKRAIRRAGIKTVATPATLVVEFERASREVWKQLAGQVYQRAQLDMVLEYRRQCRK